jgi:hypothetical protein
MKLLSLASPFVPLFAKGLLSSGPGMAAQHPGDAGIHQDTKVVQTKK